MSKKFRYFSLIIVLIIFLCVGAVSATDLDNGTTVSMSNSSVQDSVQNVYDNESTNSIDLNTSTIGSANNLSATVSDDYNNIGDAPNGNVSSTVSTSVTNSTLENSSTPNNISVNNSTSNNIGRNNSSNEVKNTTISAKNNTGVGNSSLVKPKAAGSANSNTFSISQIISAAKYVKNYYASHGKLPSTVTIGSVKVSLAQFLYYESKAISQLNSGNKANIKIIGSMDEPSSPNSGDSVSGKLTKSAYVDSATRTYKFILNYLQGPNYSTTTLKRVSYNRLIEAFSVALDYYGSNNKLPDYLTLKYGSKTTAGANSVSSVSINQIIAASKVVKEYYAANGKLPSTVMIGSVKCTLSQFLYYESKAISQLNSGNKANIPIVKSLNEPSSPNMGDVNSGNLAKSGYVDSATRTYKFILNYNQGPNYSTTTLGRVSYNNLIRAFADVLVSYGNNKRLPSSVAINNKDVTGFYNTTIIGKNVTIIGGTGTYYTVVLKDKNGKVLANKKVRFTIVGVNYDVVTDSNGIAKLQINLRGGNSYKISYLFAGDKNYNSSNGSAVIKVTKTNPNISASNVTVYYKDGSKFVIVLKDFKGNALAKKEVYLKIGNSVYKLVTDSKGKAQYVINLNPGTYTVTYSFNGDSYRYSANSTGKIVVKKLSYVIKANDLTTTSKTGYYNFSVYDNLGKKIVNQYVNVTIAGKLYTVKTDSNGNVKIAYNLSKGTYTAKISIVGNNIYNSNSASKKITINNQPATYLTINQIVNAAKVVKKYYADHGSLPSTVTIGSTKVTIAQYLYYASRAIAQINANNMANIPIIASVDPASNPNMGDTINGNLNKAGYVDSATRTYKFILNYMQAPNYSTTTLNRVSFNTLTEAFSVALDYYLSNKKLPDYLTITSGKETTAHSNSVTTKYVTINQIISAAKVVKEYYAKNKKLPKSVTVGSYKCTLAQFLYYESRAIAQINANNMGNIPIIGSLDEPSSPNMGDTIKGNLNKAGYVDSASRTYKFILNYKQGPNYSTTTVGKVSYNALIEAFSRVLAYYGENKQLPSYTAIDTTSGKDTSSITALAKSLTSGLSSDYDKAVAMFNWVRDNVLYDYYYNSQQGAALTLTKKSGNCCDQSNLYVAMCRAVGITVRYVHGYCHFTDGWYGHVWTEVYVNGKWYSADCISKRNTFGSINNWNTATATIYNRYTNLPF